jgi:hypothetical protein
MYSALLRRQLEASVYGDGTERDEAEYYVFLHYNPFHFTHGVAIVTGITQFSE